MNKNNPDQKVKSADTPKIEFKYKTGVPALFSDVMNYVARPDGMCVLSFGQTVPTRNEDGTIKIEAFEQARIIIQVEHAKRIIDLLCSNLNYIPESLKK